MRTAQSALFMAAVFLGFVVPTVGQRPASVPAAGPTRPEPRLANITQLTSGGENAEAYFSPDGQHLIYQHTDDPTSPTSCDQIYTMRVDGSEKRKISNGGRTTCGYFSPDGQSLLYASTHLASPNCPPKPSFEKGYVWPIYGSYDIFHARLHGSGLQRLTSTPGYDAEATVGPNGRIVFTSVRDGDMEIYSMNGEGSDVRRLTHRAGPDGGPWFSADGQQVVFRGHEIKPGSELDDYRTLLKGELWRPTTLEIYVMNADGGNLRQVTHLGGANFAPFFHPDGKRIIFSSNHQDPRGRNFDIYLINVDGTNLERITYGSEFDGFPMFSPDGRKLVFASNRNEKAGGETNIFVADWVGN